MAKIKELSHGIKERIVASYTKELGYQKISAELDVAVSSVCYGLKKFLALGTVTNKQRSGRPWKIDAPLGRKLTHIMESNPRSRAKELTTTCADDGIQVSRNSVACHLNRAGLYDC